MKWLIYDAGECYLRLPPNLAMCESYLFGCIQEMFRGAMAIGANDLPDEVQSMLSGISEDEKHRAFHHWIDRRKRTVKH
jgi:hypothetical protein